MRSRDEEQDVSTKEEGLAPITTPNKFWNSAMRRGAIWVPTLLLLLAYLLLHGASNMLFLESRSNPRIIVPKLLKFPASQSSIAKQGLKIYMYEMPRKFTYGVIEYYLRSRALLKESTDANLRYPGNQHSAEWWLFYDLTMPQPERFSSSSVRVFNPNDADIFYVPFFSSLSLVANAKSSEDESYSDDEMQKELMAWLEEQETWKKNGGRDHVIMCQDPNALHSLRQYVRKSILLVSDFGRFKPEQASLVKDVVLPYSHRISSYTKENNSSSSPQRSTLLFFMGNRYRKEGGKIRDQLFQVLEREKDVVIKHGMQSRESRRLAGVGMRTSKYCLHPAGDTPSACRLFDAIVSVCVPVIVSDDIELPFEDELDYTQFAIFISSSKALQPGYIASYLRGITSTELGQKQQRLREVRKYFEYEERDGAVDMIWQQVRNRLPLVRMMINRDKRLLERATGNCSCVCT